MLGIQLADVFRRGFGIDQCPGQQHIGPGGVFQPLGAGAGGVDHGAALHIAFHDLQRGIAKITSLLLPAFPLAAEQKIRMLPFQLIGLFQIAHGIDPLHPSGKGVAFHAVGPKHIDDHGDAPGLPGAFQQLMNGNFHNDPSMSFYFSSYTLVPSCLMSRQNF